MLSLPHKVYLASPNKHRYSRAGVQIHANRAAECTQAIIHQGFAVLNPLQVAVDCALTLPRGDALCIVNDFLHRQLVSYEELQSELAVPRFYGAARARKIATRMSLHCESAAESIAWDLLHE